MSTLHLCWTDKFVRGQIASNAFQIKHRNQMDERSRVGKCSWRRLNVSPITVKGYIHSTLLLLSEAFKIEKKVRNSSRNAKKIFYYHVNFQNPKCKKFHTFFFFFVRDFLIFPLIEAGRCLSQTESCL